MAGYWASLIQKMAKTFVKCLLTKDTQLSMKAVKKLKYGEIIRMGISKEGLNLIKKFEGCKLEAYRCAADVPTIAWGRTKDVMMGDTCTQEQADAWLEEEIVEYEDHVHKAVEMPLSQHQFETMQATQHLYSKRPKTSSMPLASQTQLSQYQPLLCYLCC